MGKLSAVRIRNLKEAGRYSDGEGQSFNCTGLGREAGFYGSSPMAADAISGSVFSMK